MREYGLNIPFTGLKIAEEQADYMDSMKNLAVGKGFWFTPAAYRFLSGFSQVISGKKNAFAFTGTAISIIDADFEAEEIATVSDSGWWSVADYGEAWIASNGKHTCYTGDGEITEASVRLGAVCASDAQLLYGDIDGNQNLVGWSVPDGRDLLNILEGTEYPEGEETLNLSGHIIMPWAGKVKAIVPIASDFVVYGTDGISYLTRAEDGFGVSDIPNLPAGVGVTGGWSIGNGGAYHIFRSSLGDLWRITAQGAERIGISAGDYPVCVDTVLDRAWCDGYVITPYGIGGPCDQKPDTIAVINGESVATGTGYGSEITVEAESNEIFPWCDGMRTVAGVIVSGVGLSNVKAAVRWSSNQNKNRGVTNFSNGSISGAVRLRCKTYGANVLFRAKATAGAKITNVAVRYQVDDNRYIRGPRAATGDSQG